MPSNSKLDNQYFGKYFERAIVEKINETNIVINPKDHIDTCGYDFSEKEIKILNEQAQIVADYIGHSKKAIHIGDHTVTENGDILLEDGTRIEVKRVSVGKGTYYNTSVYTQLLPFGFDLRNYIKDFKLCETINKYFPNAKAKNTNKSPVNKNIASDIKNNHKAEYEKIKSIDYEMRLAFTKDVIEFFKKNPDKFQIFYRNIYLKEKANNKVVDRFIIFNYETNQINEVDLKKLADNPNVSIETTSDLGFRSNGLRFQISWKNGTGLLNPAIYVYVE